MQAEDVVTLLKLERHPEGGWFRETWRHTDPDGGRGAGTAIYYLLAAGEKSAWHRVDATEVWHFYAGDPLLLSVQSGSLRAMEAVLGPGLAQGQRPQLVVPAGSWQSARPLGQWSLVGCTVSPAFQMEGFEMAPAGWEP